LRKFLLSLAFISLLGVGYLEIFSRIEGRLIDFTDAQKALLLLDCGGAECPGKPLINGDSLPRDFQPLYRDILETSSDSKTLHFLEIDKSGLNALGGVRFCVDSQFSSTDQMWGWVQTLDGKEISFSFLTPSWTMVKFGFFRYIDAGNSFVPCGIASRFKLLWF